MLKSFTKRNAQVKHRRNAEQPCKQSSKKQMLGSQANSHTQNAMLSSHANSHKRNNCWAAKQTVIHRTQCWVAMRTLRVLSPSFWCLSAQAWWGESATNLRIRLSLPDGPFQYHYQLSSGANFRLSLQPSGSNWPFFGLCGGGVLSGMGHTDFWVVPYGIIRYEYAIRVNTKTYLCYFGGYPG